jgi:hypothetical protein
MPLSFLVPLFLLLLFSFALLSFLFNQLFSPSTASLKDIKHFKNFLDFYQKFTILF